MLESIKQRLGRDDEQGFTLIELMVVVLIIAILLAIAIPTFLGARNSANARATQSNLRNALTAEQTQYTNNQAFDAVVADMSGIESNLDWQTAWPAAPKPNTVLVAIDANTNGVFLTGLGKDNNCYTIFALDQPATFTPAGGAATSVPAGTQYFQTGKNAAGGCSTPATPGGGPGTTTAHQSVGNWEQAF